MRIKHKKTFVICVLTVLLTIAGIFIYSKFSTPQNKDRKKAAIMEWWNKRVRDMGKSKFTISGEIVDDSGKPVNNVKVLISQGYLKNFGFEADYTESTKTVDSKFRIEISGGSSVSIRFDKKGYYPPDRISLATTGPNPSNEINAENRKIVLRRQGKLARTKRIVSNFFIKKEKIFTCYNIPKIKMNGMEYNYDQVETLPLGTIYPDAKRDEKGKIIRDFIPKTNLSRRYPGIMYLKLIGNDGDGFIRCKKLSRHGITDVKDAPVSGYDAKQIEINWAKDKGKNIYFYYKFGDTYGKGFIDFFSYTTSSGRICISGALYQNIESDVKEKRNLRTME